MSSAKIIKFSEFGDFQVVDIANDTVEVYDLKTTNLTVSDKSVILSDGTLSNTGLIASILNMQTMYNNTSVYGQCQINLTHAKNISFVNFIDNTYMIFNSATGNLQISGDLIVGGTTTVVNSVITSYDELLISPANDTSTALIIEPDNGVVPLFPLLRVKKIFGGTDVFTIGSNGTSTFSAAVVNTHLTVGGSIINTDYSTTKSTLFAHIASNTDIKHSGLEIGISGYSNPIAINAQTVIADIDQRFTTSNTLVDTLVTRVTDIENANGSLIGYKHIQNSASTTWTINHGKGSSNALVAIYNAANLLIIPHSVDTTSINTTVITFENPEIGRAVLTFVI